MKEESTEKLNDENFDMFSDKRDLDQSLIDESISLKKGQEIEPEVSFDEAFQSIRRV